MYIYICLNYKLCTDDACDSDCVKAKVTSNTDGWEGLMHKCMKMQSHLTPGLFQAVYKYTHHTYVHICVHLNLQMYMNYTKYK